MKHVLVTGASGFIGKNLTAALQANIEAEPLLYDLHCDRALADLVDECDAIVHLAGVNRPETVEGYTENFTFTDELISLLRQKRKNVPLVMTSSVQAALDNPYGNSKKQAEEAVKAWAEESGSKCYIFRFPNVFGKWCQPNYNSVVATFCNNIAKGLPITDRKSTRLNSSH